jgi:hypothetical protein
LLINVNTLHFNAHPHRQVFCPNVVILSAWNAKFATLEANFAFEFPLCIRFFFPGAMTIQFFWIKGAAQTGASAQRRLNGTVTGTALSAPKGAHGITQYTHPAGRGN